MQEHLVVSGRGQITLPAALRRRLGIKEGDVLIVDDQEGQLVLRPAAVVEIDVYSDDQIREWNEADRLPETERRALRTKLASRR